MDRRPADPALNAEYRTHYDFVICHAPSAPPPLGPRVGGRSRTCYRCYPPLCSCIRERVAALDGGVATQHEQGERGCGDYVLGVIFARPSAGTLEQARHAPAQRGNSSSNLRVLERRGAVESWCELPWHAGAGESRARRLAGRESPAGPLQGHIRPPEDKLSPLARWNRPP